MKWQLIELSFFYFYMRQFRQIIIEELPHYPPGKDIRTACVKLKLQCHFFEHRSWQLVANITVCSGLYHVPPCCTVVTWLFLPLFCKLIDGWECFTALDVSITQHSASCRIITEEPFWGDEWVGNGRIHSLDLTKLFLNCSVTGCKGDEVQCKKWVNIDLYLPSQGVRGIFVYINKLLRSYLYLM